MKSTTDAANVYNELLGVTDNAEMSQKSIGEASTAVCQVGWAKSCLHFLGLGFHIYKMGTMAVHLLLRAYFQCRVQKYMENIYYRAWHFASS